MSRNNKTSIQITDLTYSYSGISEPLFTNFTASISDGWTAVTGNNGSGKSTLLKLIAGLIGIQSGRIKTKGKIYYCRQETDLNLKESEDFFYSVYEKNSEAGKLGGILNINMDWFSMKDNLNYILSEGEKKRLQIACALNSSPDILIVDEPFNHIDEEGRKIITDVLSMYKGCGLLVSHDRGLSDRLCRYTIIIENKTAELLNGTASQALSRKIFEKESSRNSYKKVKAEIDNLRKESQNRKKAADEADRKKSKKSIGRKDHDAKAKIDLVRLSGKDGQAGRLSKQIESRIRQKQKELAAIDLTPDLKTGISIEGQRCQKDSVINIKAGKISIGAKKISFPDLLLRPGEKAALSGKNGSGKTSLIKYILSELISEADRILYIPQELTGNDMQKIRREINLLNSEDKGKVYSNFSRLGSDAEKLIESSSPSPGEWKKLMISSGIIYNPVLIILDEPVNHMDLSSIKSLEEALISLDCAILTVSHDKTFRNNISGIEWNIKEGQSENTLDIKY